MKVINLTPHDVNICDENGNVIKTYKASGLVARVAHKWHTLGTIDGVPYVDRQGYRTVNLPDAQDDVMYIVSNIVLEACHNERIDLLAPVQQVKDKDGRVIGCRSFICY